MSLWDFIIRIHEKLGDFRGYPQPQVTRVKRASREGQSEEGTLCVGCQAGLVTLKNKDRQTDTYTYMLKLINYYEKKLSVFFFHSPLRQ